jgi:hypothetical protein
MKTPKLLWIGLVLLAAAIGVVFLFAPRKPPLVKIAISGTAGLPVKGSYIADGVTHEVAAVVPTDIFIAARHVSYSITKGNEPGELRVELSVHCAHHGAAATSQPSGGCRGEMRNGAVVLQTTF